jgi:hypothetical protein
VNADAIRKFLAYAVAIVLPVSQDLVNVLPTHTIAFKVAAAVVGLFAALRIHPNGVNGPAAASVDRDSGATSGG